MSMTLDIWLSLLEILSKLYISIDFESLHVFIQCFSTKLQLMKILVALELTNVYTETVFAVLVVSKKIEKYNKAL